MNRLLVTGGAGFIGVNFVKHWLEHNSDDRLVALDVLTYAGNHNSLAAVQKDPRFTFVQGDILNTALIENILETHNIDTVVHFAAESHVDRSIEGPDAFIETNIIGTHSLLKACRKHWITEGNKTTDHLFHHVSTDEVFGSLEPEDPAFSESTPYAPNSPYSSSKAASDFFVRAYHHTYGLNVTTSNCSNNYGPYQFPEKLIPLVILNILHGKDIPVYGSGENVRDWLYVDDHAAGIELIIKNGKHGETYNIGGNNEWKNIDIVKLICTLIDETFAENAELRTQFPDCPASSGKTADSLISFVTDRAGHDFRYAIDNTYINKELGFEPKVTFENGIRKTLQWYLSEQDWWESILDGSYRDSVPQDAKGAIQA